jgi:drug/metabolite transporter (DMT)-like permease
VTVQAAALALVLASALLHAAWNALLKRAANLEATSVGILAVAFLSTAAATPFLPGPAFPVPAAVAWGIGAGGFEGLYFLVLCRALERAPLGWTYTWMRGGSILVVWPISLLFLREALTPLSAGAVLVICGGLALMGIAPARGAARGTLGWVLAVAGAIGGFTLCYKLSLSHGAHPVPLFALSMAVSLPVQGAVRLARNGWDQRIFLTTQWGLTLGAGVLCTLSFVLYLMALALGGAGVMATLRNTSVVFALVFSRFLGERPPARQWLGACLVAAGAVALAWPR